MPHQPNPNTDPTALVDCAIFSRLSFKSCLCFPPHELVMLAHKPLLDKVAGVVNEVAGAVITARKVLGQYLFSSSFEPP